MSLPAALFVMRCLTADTFRQALASRVFWLMLAASGLCILFCLSVSITGPASLQPPSEIELYGGDDRPLTGPNPAPGEMTLGFGMLRVQLPRDAQTEVQLLEALLAKWVAGAAGMLLALVWTAAFLPDFLQPSAASVLLAKPLPRWILLAGKYLGVVVFVAFQAAIFVGGTWLALGLRTGLWTPGYLLAVPLLVLHFAMIYSVSVLLAVCTRSTVSCIFGSILFWLVCFGVNYARHATVAQPLLAPEAAPCSPLLQATVEASYWTMPKPADILILLDQALKAREHLGSVPAFETVVCLDAFRPEFALLTSLLFTLAILVIAAIQFTTLDY